MQLFAVVRGLKSDVDRFISDLQAQYFNFKWKRDGKEYYTGLELGVREIKFLELSFPEEHLDTILATVQPYDQYKQVNKYTNFLRKLLKLDKIPMFKEGSKMRPTWKMTHPDIRVVGIGLKKDNYGKAPDGKGGFIEGEMI